MLQIRFYNLWALKVLWMRVYTSSMLQGSGCHWFLLFSAPPHKNDNSITEDHFDGPKGETEVCGFLMDISPRGEMGHVQKPSKDPVIAGGESISPLCTDPLGPFALSHARPCATTWPAFSHLHFMVLLQEQVVMKILMLFQEVTLSSG